MVKPNPDPPIVHLSSSLRCCIASPSARRPYVTPALDDPSGSLLRSRLRSVVGVAVGQRRIKGARAVADALLTHDLSTKTL
jgi:hypothetical protein